jgi:hypothetical protein
MRRELFIQNSENKEWVYILGPRSAACEWIPLSASIIFQAAYLSTQQTALEGHASVTLIMAATGVQCKDKVVRGISVSYMGNSWAAAGTKPPAQANSRKLTLPSASNITERPVDLAFERDNKLMEIRPYGHVQYPHRTTPQKSLVQSFIQPWKQTIGEHNFPRLIHPK